jgi:hypothetical protein
MAPFYNSPGICGRVYEGPRRKTMIVQRLFLEKCFLRIVRVLVSVAVALFAAIYASAAFGLDLSPGAREGTPITVIVFTSVFVPLFVILVAIGAWVINRKYRNAPHSK